MNNGKKGFSLTETTILCFVGTTLLALLTVSAVNSRESARTIGCMNNMKNILQAVELYHGDFKTTPGNISDLYPMYITDERIFKCPEDRTDESNSYENFYIGRFIDTDDPNKVLFSCPRHYKSTRTVAAYLSYAVAPGEPMQVEWNGIPVEPGGVYPGGDLTFADGTTVNIRSGSAGLHSSFLNNAQKIQTIIYTTDGNSGTLQVKHNSDSKFTIITPSVIADVKNAEIDVTNTAGDGEQQSDITVNSGKVIVEDRRFDAVGTAVTQSRPMTPVTVAVTNSGSSKGTPRKPRKSR